MSSGLALQIKVAMSISFKQEMENQE